MQAFSGSAIIAMSMATNISKPYNGSSLVGETPLPAARFVVLRHDCPRGLHWDFMLEAEGVLRTWALAEEPSAGVACAAEQLPDHRLAYLDYEGEVSGGRGSVTRYDQGEYRLEKDDAAGVVMELRGTRLCGTAALVPVGETQRWRFSFQPSF